MRWPRAPAVSEHAAVLEAKAVHLGRLGQIGRLLVERLDLVHRRPVLVGHRLVGDAGITDGHAQRAVPEQLGDRFEPHSPVHRLGGERVAQLVGMDVSDPCPFRHPVHHPGDDSGG